MPVSKAVRPCVLVILDGWGLSDAREGNAIALAETPTYDRLRRMFPMGRVEASGADVGLPAGQMGNSEVGHLNLGAGFVVEQDLTRLNAAVATGRFADNPALAGAFDYAEGRGGRVHLVGLIGAGGVHAHATHLTALLAMGARRGAKVLVHAVTDGRDSAPTSGLPALRALVADMARLGVGRVASVSGRYYVMDRDKRWERQAAGWNAVVHGIGVEAGDPVQALIDAYAAGVTDEFVVPTVMTEAGRAVGPVRPGDAVILFNFRADRMRQMLLAFTQPQSVGFAAATPPNVHVVTLTKYVKNGSPVPVAFGPTEVDWPLARVVAEQGLRQYHTAETEKYAHVTYFFNGGLEEAFAGEERFLAPSLQVATYDLAPEMSARAVTEALVRRIVTVDDGFRVVNFANPDMVGHTGNLAAAVAAVECVDACLGRVLAAAEERGVVAVITADHGNCEQMIDPVTGGPHTAHTTNPTPLFVVGPGLALADGGRLADGRLSDVTTTVLAVMGLPAPATMTGQVLLTRSVGQGQVVPL